MAEQSIWAVFRCFVPLASWALLAAGCSGGMYGGNLVVSLTGPPSTRVWLIPLEDWEEYEMAIFDKAPKIIQAAQSQVARDGQGTFYAREKTYVLVVECAGQRVFKQQVQPSMYLDNKVSFSCP